jgi:hypothetical protein
MSEDNIQLPNYLCFKPSKAKLGQNGNYFNSMVFFFEIKTFCYSGLFATRILKPNEPLGIYRGKIRRTLPQTADEEYVWAVSLFFEFFFINISFN